MIEASSNYGNGTLTLDALPAGMSPADLAEILFCSTLQPSQPADPAAVREALSQTLRTRDGLVTACAEELAESYGKDPEITCRRMRWARDLVCRVFPNVPAFG